MNLSFGFSRAVENAQGPPRKTTFHVNYSMELLEIWVFFFVFFGRNKKKGMKAMGWGGLGWGGCGKWTARKLHNSFTECLAGVARVWRKRIGFESSQRFFFGERSPESSIQKYLQMSGIFRSSMTLPTRKPMGAWPGKLCSPSWDVSVVYVFPR